MGRNGVLEIVRGARDVAKARTNSNFGRKTLRKHGRSRVRGQVGVAVRRDDNNDLLPAYDSRHDEDEHEENETADSGQDSLRVLVEPRTARTQQAGNQPQLDTTSHGIADLTRDSPGPTGGTHRRVADADSSSDRGVRAQSLGSWLQPPPPPAATGAAKTSNARRKRPLRDTESSELPRDARKWTTTSSLRRDNETPITGRAGGDGSLSAWLEPRQTAASRERRSTMRRSESFDGKVGHGSKGNSDCGGGDDDDDEDDSARWMSDRLDGLDPNGAARAKDSWTDRERRNLSCTDVALGAKRKGRGGGRRGWKTNTGGRKVMAFVAPGIGGGGVISRRQAGSRLFKGSGGGDRKKRKI